MTVEQTVRNKREEIHRIAQKHGVKSIRIFGSVARGEARADSDVDFLVEVGPEASSWFPAGLVLELEEILGCKVEVVTEKGLNPLLKDHVLQEAVVL